jgi:threonine dehydratase
MAIIFLVAPLLVVAAVLLKIKKKALLEYGAQVIIHNQLFDKKWIQKSHPEDETLLGTLTHRL